MPKTQHGPFTGMRPVAGEEYLGENEAITCRNFELDDGTLRPSRAPMALTAGQAVSVPASTKGLYQFDKSGAGVWFAWPAAAEVVRGPIANDANLRTYMTSADIFSEPRYTTKNLITQQNGIQPL